MKQVGPRVRLDRSINFGKDNGISFVHFKTSILAALALVAVIYDWKTWYGQIHLFIETFKLKLGSQSRLSKTLSSVSSVSLFNASPANTKVMF